MEKTGSDFDGKRSEKANEACKESDGTSLLFFFRSLFLWTSANDNITRILSWDIVDTLIVIYTH